MKKNEKECNILNLKLDENAKLKLELRKSSTPLTTSVSTN